MARIYKPLTGHRFHSLNEAELRYVIKDAGEAAQAMRDHDSRAANKYADQVNDACTVLAYRRSLAYASGRA
jgi:hypothetical protein